MQMAASVLVALKRELKGLFDYDTDRSKSAYERVQKEWAKALYRKSAHQLVRPDLLADRLEKIGFDLTKDEMTSKKRVLDYILGGMAGEVENEKARQDAIKQQQSRLVEYRMRLAKPPEQVESERAFARQQFAQMREVIRSSDDGGCAF